MKKKKWMLLFSNFSAIFLLSAGCSVTSNVPLSKKEKVENPNNNNNNNNDDDENQKPGDSNGEIKNPTLPVKPEPDPLPPKAPEKPTEPPKKPDITVEKPKKDEPPEIKVPKNTPVSEDSIKTEIKIEKKVADSGDKQKKPKEKFITKVFDPRTEQSKSDVELVQLKAHLSTLPSVLFVAGSRKNDNPLTLVYNARNQYKDLSYYNIVNPVGEDETKYELKLDFSNANYNNSSSKVPIKNVTMKLSLKEDPSINSSKIVTILYEKKEQKYELKSKLPDGFNNIFPSFIAFLLLNKDKNDVISLPFFNDLGFIFNERNFGVGLKDQLIELKPVDSEKDNYQYNFEVVSAQPDDKNGILKLNLQIWRVIKNSNNDNKELLPEISKVEISGFAKNSDKKYEFEVAEKGEFEKKLLDQKLKDKLLKNELDSEFTKNDLLKLLFENLHIRIHQDVNVNQKWIEPSKLKIGNWLIYPQIQYLNLDSTKFTQNLTLTREGNKINWKFELNTYLLSENQTLTPESRDFLLGEKKTHVIQGSFDLEKN